MVTDVISSYLPLARMCIFSLGRGGYVLEADSHGHRSPQLWVRFSSMGSFVKMRQAQKNCGRSAASKTILDLGFTRNFN